MMKSKVKERIHSILVIIAGSAGGGAIVLVGLIVFILVLINRYVFYKVGTLPKVQNTNFLVHINIIYVLTKK